MNFKQTAAIAFSVLFNGLVLFAQIYDTNNIVVSTFAGSGFSGYVDGQGTQTMFNFPEKIVSDSFSNLFVLDGQNNKIRKITSQGLVTTFASIPSGYNAYSFLGIDHSNILFLTGNNINSGDLVKIGTNGNLTTTTSTGLSLNSQCCFDSKNNLYYTDFNGNKIYRKFTNGTLETFCGSGNNGAIDGNGLFCSFSQPTAITCDISDNIFVYDSGTYRIRRINQNKDVLTVAGVHSGGDLDGVGTNTSFSSKVCAMCSDNLGNIYFACGKSVRKMDSSLNVITLAGSFSETGYADGAGNFSRFYNGYSGSGGICFSSGGIFIADTGNQRVRKIIFNASSEIVPGNSLSINIYSGVTILGLVGRTYQIQSSLNNTTWITQDTIFLNKTPFLWVDTNSVSGNKFYRAFMMPQ